MENVFVYVVDVRVARAKECSLLIELNEENDCCEYESKNIGRWLPQLKIVEESHPSPWKILKSPVHANYAPSRN